MEIGREIMDKPPTNSNNGYVQLSGHVELMDRGRLIQCDTRYNRISSD